MEFKSPFSRIEAILQNILGADNVLEDPLSRAEVILLAILNDTEITEELNYDEMSELEALLYAIKESDEEYNKVPETRSGKILLKILHGEKYEGETASRVEELLKEWSHTAAWYVKTVGPGNPINVTDALAEPAVGLKIDLSPIQESTPWIDTVANTTPYLLRPTETTGNTADEKLVGGSVVWNQMVNVTTIASKSDVDVIGTNNGDGTYTVNGTASGLFEAYASIIIVANHLYYICGCPSGGSKSTYELYITSIIRDFGNGVLYKVPPTGLTISPDIIVHRGATVNNLVFKPQLFDLTQMFANNPAIADYIYSLEQTSAGSGIAWLKSYGFFTKDYYPYNPGEIMSMKAYSKRVVGFNLWDEVWENGAIDSDGQNYDSPPNMRSKNYIPVIPNATYYIKSSATSGRICMYDINKNFIFRTNSTYVNKTFSTTRENVAYIRFYVSQATYNNDICINLSDPNRNGEYEPYKEQTYTLGNDELRGLFKLDTTTNKLYTDGDIKTSDGAIARKMVPITLNGTENWIKVSSDDNAYFRINIGYYGSVVYGSIISDKYIATNITSSTTDVGIYIFNSTTINAAILSIRPVNASSLTVQQFNALLAENPVHCCYRLTTPTTESSTPFTNPQDVYAGCTEEFVDERTIPIPVGHETIYSNVQEIIGYDGIIITHGTDESDPSPTEYQVLFQDMGTVYSGSLDVLSGVLTVDMAEVDLGTKTWRKAITVDNTFYISLSDMNDDITNLMCIKCSVYPTVTRTDLYDKTISKGNTDNTKDRVYIQDSKYNSADATTFKSAMSGVQLVYELATPITYNLTPVEVEMLLNNNYLKSDGGVMTLTYKGTNPAILLMNKLRTSALMRKTKEIQNGNLQPILPNTKQL